MVPATQSGISAPLHHTKHPCDNNGANLSISSVRIGVVSNDTLVVNDGDVEVGGRELSTSRSSGSSSARRDTDSDAYTSTPSSGSAATTEPASDGITEAADTLLNMVTSCGSSADNVAIRCFQDGAQDCNSGVNSEMSRHSAPYDPYAHLHQYGAAPGMVPWIYPQRMYQSAAYPSLHHYHQQPLVYPTATAASMANSSHMLYPLPEQYPCNSYNYNSYSIPQQRQHHIYHPPHLWTPLCPPNLKK